MTEADFFEATEHLKQPEWFRRYYFTRPDRVFSPVSQRLVSFFVQIQDNPSWLKEYLEKTFIQTYPLEWVQIASEQGHLATLRFFLAARRWKGEEVAQLVARQGAKWSPEVIKTLLSYEHLNPTLFVCGLLIEASLTNSVLLECLLSLPKFENALKPLGLKGFYRTMEEELLKILGPNQDIGYPSQLYRAADEGWPFPKAKL